MMRGMSLLVCSMFATACGANGPAFTAAVVDAGADAGSATDATSPDATSPGSDARSPTCPAPSTQCGLFCTDLSIDSQHCGSCTTQCGDFSTCVHGICTGA